MRSILTMAAVVGLLLGAAGPAGAQPDAGAAEDGAAEQEGQDGGAEKGGAAEQEGQDGGAEKGVPAKDDRDADGAAVTGADAAMPPGGTATEAPPTEDEEGKAPPPTVGDAKTHLRLARAYYDSGRFEQAAQEFRAAYQASDDPRLLYNVFLALRDAGAIAEAIDALERYLRLVPDAPRREALRKRLVQMRRLQEQSARTREDGERASEGGDAEGAGDEGEGPPPEAGSEDLDPKDGEQAPEGMEVDPGTEGGPSVLSWVVMGVGVAALAGGTVTGVMALRQEKDLESACGPGGGGCPPGFQSDVERGQRLATTTDVLIGVGLLGAGAGLAMFLLLDDDTQERAPTSPDATTASIDCGPTGCAGRVKVRF